MLIHGDCLEEMKKIPDKSVDMCLTDPPYGTTACKWDTVIPFEPMWAELHRIVKDNGAICLFGSEPFSSALRLSNIRRFKHDWIWNKLVASNFAAAKYQPLKEHEIISIFSYKTHVYFPLKISRRGSGQERCKYKGSSTGGKQSVSGIKRNQSGKMFNPNERNPCSIIELNPRTERRGAHPTQKPVALLEYLIKTYTLENETVLDFTMGSGSTGVACKNLGRKFIGIEKDKTYFDIAVKRISES